MTFDPHGRDALQIGQAGEHLVCLDLLRWFKSIREIEDHVGFPHG